MNAPVEPTALARILARPRGSGFLPRVAFALLRMLGWRVVLATPIPRKSVVVFYPHTSNWDFPVGLLAKWIVGIDFRWVGKHTLFKRPLRRWFLRWGGIPVDRRAAAGFVGQLAAAFATHEDFALVITPEGTRSRVPYWKSGFYRLAVSERLPVGLAFIDRASRTVGVGAWIALSGDAERDLATMRAFYADKRGWTPSNAGPIVFRPSADARERP